MRSTLSLAGPADLPQLLPLVAAYYRFEGIRFDPARARRALRQLLNRPDFGRIWLVTLNAELIGYIVLCFSFSVENGGRDALIDEFFVRAPFRGRGIGRALLRRACADLRRSGVKSIYLEASRDNAIARRFYRALGFRARDKYSLMDLDLDARPARPAGRAEQRRQRRRNLRAIQ